MSDGATPLESVRSRATWTADRSSRRMPWRSATLYIRYPLMGCRRGTSLPARSQFRRVWSVTPRIRAASLIFTKSRVEMSSGIQNPIKHWYDRNTPRRVGEEDSVLGRARGVQKPARRTVTPPPLGGHGDAQPNRSETRLAERSLERLV